MPCIKPSDERCRLQARTVEVICHELQAVHGQTHGLQRLVLLREDVDQRDEAVHVRLDLRVPEERVRAERHQDPAAMVQLVLAIAMQRPRPPAL